MTNKTKTKQASTETDSSYILKLVLYLLIGSVWLRFANPLYLGSIQLNGLPIGLLIGLIFASHDHFQVDRKIEYALLLVVTVVSFFLPIGIFI